MARRLIVNNRCPLCGEQVEVVMDAMLKRDPDNHNTEMILTKRGLKQYLHSSCWYEMIREKRPYKDRKSVV